MMAMFGWRDNRMPALYIAKASRDKLAISGMEKIEAYDQMENRRRSGDADRPEQNK
jgi:hypothetical protein